jgi:hypothetical protein
MQYTLADDTYDMPLTLAQDKVSAKRKLRYEFIGSIHPVMEMKHCIHRIVGLGGHGHLCSFASAGSVHTLFSLSPGCTSGSGNWRTSKEAVRSRCFLPLPLVIPAVEVDEQPKQGSIEDGIEDHRLKA